jgi:membrane-bound lytic murein transglycosylase C
MKKLFILFILLSLTLTADNFEDYRNEQESSFTEYKENLEKDFTTYNNILKEELENYKNSIRNVWSDEKLPDKNTWIEYSKDLDKRKIVDFENGVITLEAVVDKNTDSQKLQMLFMKEFGNLILQDTQTAYKKDSLMQTLEKRFEKELSTYQKGETDKKPLLADVYLDKDGSKDLSLNKMDIEKTLTIAKEAVTKNKITTKKAKENNKKIVSIQIKMPSSTTLKKARAFKDDVLKFSKKEKIDPALTYAIMHSESSFNPMARSHIPAYGLMQIVPKSAGIDVSRKLYGKEKILSPKFLYNSSNNIMSGTAYLNILFYSYLKNIDNELSRYYCTIAAYNTGAGNVAKAFIGTTNIKNASKKINEMTPKEVYNTLLKKLPYDETKHYLKKVSERMIIYDKALDEGL